MRIKKDQSSPWGQRLFFEDREFESMMDELRLKAGDNSFVEGSGIDVDLILLRVLGIEPDYVDLPENVLGRVLFSVAGKAEIQISRKLADDAENDVVSRRRLRMTLSHECGHASCHSLLFVGDTATISFFEEIKAPKKPPILCRESTIDKPGYSGEWWEFQANQCMVALLLPRKLFSTKVRAQFELFKIPSFTEAIRAKLDNNIIHNLADIFDVNPISILFRMEKFGFIPKKGQSSLAIGQQ
jgi:hypothetical protein